MILRTLRGRGRNLFLCSHLCRILPFLQEIFFGFGKKLFHWNQKQRAHLLAFTGFNDKVQPHRTAYSRSLVLLPRHRVHLCYGILTRYLRLRKGFIPCACVYMRFLNTEMQTVCNSVFSRLDIFVLGLIPLKF